MKNKAECRAIDEPLPPEFLEALNLCTKLISVRATGDPDRLTVANDSLRADLLGDPPVPTLISAADQPVVTLLHSFLELMQVPNHFKAMATMVRLYPWGGKISRSQHMESCYYLIVHETYILEERLKAFTKALIECATSQSFEVDLSSAHKYAIKLHNAFFGEMVAARGIHVHQRSYVPREIKRLGTLELLMLNPLNDPTVDAALWRFLHRLAFRDARKKWIKNADDASKAAQYVIGHLLVQTQLVWRTVMQEELNKLEPIGASTNL